MSNRWNLTTPEVNALIELVMYHWRPEERQRFAQAMPAVYAKLTGTRVIVDTDEGCARIYAEVKAS